MNFLLFSFRIISRKNVKFYKNTHVTIYWGAVTIACTGRRKFVFNEKKIIICVKNLVTWPRGWVGSCQVAHENTCKYCLSTCTHVQYCTYVYSTLSFEKSITAQYKKWKKKIWLFYSSINSNNEKMVEWHVLYKKIKKNSIILSQQNLGSNQ